MAKRKTKTTTKTSTSRRTRAPHLGVLVSTQRAAIEAVANKHDLAALFLKLAGKHGTPEQQALKLPDLEREPRDTIEALVAALAVTAHEGHKVRHLSELGGWPACWSDERREACGPDELLLTPISVTEEAVTCPKCKKAADIPSPAETAAMERAEVEAAEEKPAKKGERSPKKEGEAPAPRAKRQLALKESLSVRLKIKDLEVNGVVRPDGSMSVRNKVYASPHEAANELAGNLVKYRIDGFQAWRYEDEQGRWRMLRDHA